jgi:hypothetical protein
MESTSSVKAASTVETAPSARRGETVESTASADSGAAAESAVKSVPAAAIESRPAPVEGPAAVEAATAIEPMEPRTGANKHSPGKIIRSVVAVGRACVRGIPVVAIRADRGRANVGRAKLNCNLRMGCPCNNHEKPEQNDVL